jgi:hypothetical protein
MYDGAAQAARRRGGSQARQEITRGCAMREVCLDQARASRASTASALFLFKESERRKRKAGGRRSTLMSPLIGRHAQHLPRLRRRGASREAQAGRRRARWCDCSEAGCAVVLSAGASGTHPPALCEEQPRSSRSRPNPSR